MRRVDTSNVPNGKISRSGFASAFRLYKYMKPYRVQYMLGMFFLLGSSLGSLAFPKLLGDMVNGGERSSLGLTLNQTALLIAGILVLRAVFSYFRIVLFVNVTEKSLAALRLASYRHLIKLPLHFFEKRRVGELNSRISADVALLQETMTTTLAEFIRQIVVITGGITLLAITSIQLTGFMLIVLPPAMVFAKFFGKFIRKFSKEVQTKVADSNTIVEETLQGIQSVKTFTNEFVEIARYKKKTKEIADLGMTSGKYRGAFSSFIILGLFGAISAVVWRGSVLLQKGEMVAGDLFSFVIYSVFVGGTIGGLATVYANIQKFIGATEDLFKIYDEEPEDIQELDEIDPQYRMQGKVSLRNLSFAYPSRKEQSVLKNINLDIQSNKMIALVGPSGAGKSTLASLLLMLHRPPKDTLFFDQVDSHEYPLSALRRQISLVPQDIFLFGGSIGENIAYGNPNASEREVYKAAENANALEFINRFPEKFETIVGERGTQLSGGQRQRIAIARAILNDPKILILDEATSSLDSESEMLVQEALEKLMVGRTSIIIAHRLSTIRKADEIVVLEQGEVVEQGTHEKLMSIRNGRYKKLIELQYSA
ncbi:ABC transporter ATP-binding protein [Saccharicrinis fermentans]|uniref:Multidrug resistance ABC transporter ATP-binding/permease protein BmrA n=1 Tax=Saccharicrinis fermentans DSM 9555 = JCM 21142 TaxID=869213 RepID=W7XZ18_9BACT|nr:ABC transporter transmembrane domain-containing protein [Saccharicrinis fermentans]GAF03915.1 multidrug resistance ABC transporter ATP-binding/permease protein BmrA [Saccharicrinis fermentans DSM 9555 = JCM 21142]